MYANTVYTIEITNNKVSSLIIDGIREEQENREESKNDAQDQADTSNDAAL